MDADYRKQEFVVYDVPIIKGEDLVFDLGAFFFNLTRIKRCYQRFRRIVTMPDGKDLIDAILSSEHSLYHDFMTLTRNKKEYSCEYECPYDSEKSIGKDICTYYDSRWLSFCSIRNVEILQDFLKTVQKKEVDRSKYDREILAAFFESCSEYSISTYDVDLTDGNKCYHNIQFDFLEKVALLLRDPNIDGHFVPIFGDNPQLAKLTTVQAHY